MIKIFLIVLLNFSFCQSGWAEYLNWFIDPTDASLSSYDFSGVRLGWYKTSDVKSDQSLSDYISVQNVIVYSNELYPAFDGALLVSYDISSIGTDYSYFIELVNYDTAIRHVAFSTAYTYSELSNNGYISYTDMASMGYGSSSLSASSCLSPVLMGASFGDVPEPTSGSCFVYGVLLIALRRRRC